mmetsp:Transcript_10703/g.40043  ORF Transcript_10703/g.40043 Transcript_10703/m.40043 type:complete len:248 (-) Transcript_10703:1560-2303(-)
MCRRECIRTIRHSHKNCNKRGSKYLSMRDTSFSCSRRNLQRLRSNGIRIVLLQTGNPQWKSCALNCFSPTIRLPIWSENLQKVMLVQQPQTAGEPMTVSKMHRSKDIAELQRPFFLLSLIHHQNATLHQGHDPLDESPCLSMRYMVRISTISSMQGSRIVSPQIDLQDHWDSTREKIRFHLCNTSQVSRAAMQALTRLVMWIQMFQCSTNQRTRVKVFLEGKENAKRASSPHSNTKTTKEEHRNTTL